MMQETLPDEATDGGGPATPPATARKRHARLGGDQHQLLRADSPGSDACASPPLPSLSAATADGKAAALEVVLPRRLGADKPDKLRGKREGDVSASMSVNSGGETAESSSIESSDDESDGKRSRGDQLRRWVHRLRQTFGTPFLLLVSAVYAVQGFASFCALAVNFFFKDDLDLQPAQAQTLLTVMMVPWGVKPLYGIISDSLPLFGYHRKSYMVLCSALGALATLTMSIPGAITSPLPAVLVLMLNSLSTAVIDVVIDARVVEMSRLDPKHGANDLQSVSWVSMSVGGVLGSFLSGPATDYLGVRGVFFFAAIGPLLILAFSINMREQKAVPAAGNGSAASRRKQFVSSARRQLGQLKSAIKTPVIWKCALWVFLSGAISPGYSQVSFYFATDVLHFSPEFLGTVSAFGYIFLLVGTLVYNAFFKDVSFRRIFLIAQLSLAVVSMLDVVLVTRANLKLGIPDKAFVLGDAVIADVVSRLKSMPVLVLCAKLCPRGVEGTLFALLMSISNCSRSVSEFWGALICAWLGIAKDHYDHLWIAIVFRSVLKLTPIFFLFLIPTTDPQEVVDQLDFGSTDDDEAKESGDSESESDSEGGGKRRRALSGTIREDHAVATESPMVTPRAQSPPPLRKSTSIDAVV
jgi:folate/biopterin transporter